MPARVRCLAAWVALVLSACGGTGPTRVSDTPADVAPEVALRPGIGAAVTTLTSTTVSSACDGLALPPDAESVVCARSKSGEAWIAALVPLARRTKANFDLVFIHERGGRRISSKLEPVLATRLTGKSFLLYDFDGDGHDEWFLRVGEGHRFMTVRDGEVATYPHPAGPIVGFADADEDGLIEPVYRQDLGTAITCDGPKHVQLLAAAHARSHGRFVMDDDVVQAELRRECPSPPAGPLLDTPPASGGPGFAARCARLWGRRGADVVDQLVAECAPHRRGGAQCEGRCRDLDVWLAFAMADPPVTIHAR